MLELSLAIDAELSVVISTRIGRAKRLKIKKFYSEKYQREIKMYYIFCDCCGELLPWFRGNIVYLGTMCEDCKNELKFGIIRNQNTQLGQGTPWWTHDPSPWQENAIRCLEG